jgi:putative phosphoesterase
MKIGIISDTHGLLRPQAIAALQGVDHILHAGDIGDDTILETLRQIAPLTAIRGNTDHYGLCGTLPETEAIELDGRLFYLVHSVHDLDLNPVAAGIAAVITGHTHNPAVEQRQGVLYLNPGSAGPRRFSLPTTLATLDLSAPTLSPTLIDLLA